MSDPTTGESKFRTTIGQVRIPRDEPMSDTQRALRRWDQGPTPHIDLYGWYEEGEDWLEGKVSPRHAHVFFGSPTRWQRFKRWFARVILRRKTTGGPLRDIEYHPVGSWDAGEITSVNGREVQKYYVPEGHDPSLNRTKHWMPKDLRHD